MRKLMPLVLAFAAQATFGPPGFASSGAGRNDGRHDGENDPAIIRRDSVQQVIRTQAQEILAPATPLVIHPVATPLSPAEAKNRDDYHLLNAPRDDGRRPLRTYDLRKAVAEHKDKHQSLAYLNDRDRLYHVSMARAEALLETADAMAKQYRMPPMNIYLRIDDTPQASYIAEDNHRQVTGEMTKGQPGIVLTTRMLQAVGNDGMAMLLYHEGGHHRFRPQNNPLFEQLLDEVKQDPHRPQEAVNQKLNDLMRGAEYGADDMARQALGEERVLAGMAEILHALSPQPGDSKQTRQMLEHMQREEKRFTQSDGSHPTLANRIGAVILMGMYRENGRDCDALMAADHKAIRQWPKNTQ